MIPLRGRAASTHLPAPLSRTLWRVDTTAHAAALDSTVRAMTALRVRAGEVPPAEHALCLTEPGTPATTMRHPAIELPADLNYLAPGDIVHSTPDGTDLHVLWRVASDQNSILLTERCDNYCLMCSQPPRDRDDHWLLDQANELLTMLPRNTRAVCFTGGEPTL